MKRCRKCHAEKAADGFYAGKATCTDCVRAAARIHQRVYYREHVDQCRAAARARSRRRYEAMTPAERKQWNRARWRRWGRRRYVRRIRAANAARYPPDHSPATRFLREIAAAQDAETKALLSPAITRT